MPYTPDYSDHCRHSTSLEMETDAGDKEEEDNNDNDKADGLTVRGGDVTVGQDIYVEMKFPKIKQ